MHMVYCFLMINIERCFNNVSNLDFRMASKYFTVAAISSASFLLGHYSSTIREKFATPFREAHSESVLVAHQPEFQIGLVEKAEFWKSPSRASEIMRFGYPGYDNIRVFTDFVVSYDRKTRTAHWVLEHLSKVRHSTIMYERIFRIIWRMIRKSIVPNLCSSLI